MTRNEQPGFDPALYDKDFYAWTQRQAAALRAMPRDAVSREVDIEHVAEEIEDLGKRDVREVRSYLGHLVEHLVKVDADPKSRDAQHWRHEARVFARDARQNYTRSMRQLLDITSIWQDGLELAEDYLTDHGIRHRAPTSCPLFLDDMLEGKFDLDAALAKLAAARSAPSP